MMRINTGPLRHRKHRKLLQQAKGFTGSRSRHFKVANEAVNIKMQHASLHRRKRPGQMRSMWIQRLSAVARICGTSYSVFYHDLKVNYNLNRKTMSQMCVESPAILVNMYRKNKLEVQL